MSKYQISFKLLEFKPIMPNLNDYSFQLLSYDTKFKDYLSLTTNCKITDSTNLKKSLKYIIKLIKKGKILGVGNFSINQELITKKIKQKKYNNINLFITDNNYKKIFPNTDLSKLNKYQTGITVSIEININYNIKEKNISLKKLKLMRRNFSYQEKANNKDASIKSSNNITTSTTNINTFNNLNNLNDNDTNNMIINNTECNMNVLSLDKDMISTPPYLLSSPNVGSPLSDSGINKKRKRIIRKGLIDNISFKNNNKKVKNRIIENKKNYYNVFDLRNKIDQRSSRNNNNNKFLYNKKKLNLLITQESSSSKNSNTITSSSIINSALIENNEDINSKNSSKIITLSNNNNNDTIQNIINNKSAYNKDNENDNVSFDFYLKEIEARKNILLSELANKNKLLFNQEEKYNKLLSSLNEYDNKIKNTKIIINKLQEKNDLLKYKEEIILERNKELITIISKVKQAKAIENNIINLILKNYKDCNENKKNVVESSIEKYDKNLMVKMLKNVIQNNYNVDLYLNDENKKKLKMICDKYNIFGSIIEDVDE